VTIFPPFGVQNVYLYRHKKDAPCGTSLAYRFLLTDEYELRVDDDVLLELKLDRGLEILDFVNETFGLDLTELYE
jgi:hypothetical protein